MADTHGPARSSRFWPWPTRLAGRARDLLEAAAVAPRRLETPAVVLLVVAGAALRAVHLGTPSLWWDEVVQIAMAQAGDLTDVLRAVRHGIPAGSGNAGAMPLDYVLLHGWLALASMPAPERLEAHFRLPAFVWSVAALVLFAAGARRWLGRAVGLVATLLLALSLPHVLYAAEVRWYALLGLVTVAHVWAFARLLAAPDAPGRYGLWLVAAFASLLTAVLSAIPLAAELLVLVVWSTRRPTPRHARTALLACAGVLAVAVTWLVWPTLGVGYGRPPTARPGFLASSELVVGFLAWDDPVLLSALVLGPLAAWRAGGARRAIAAALVLSFAAVPVVTALAELKHYYVHPRHVVFLLIPVVVLAAFGIVGACRLVVGRRWALAASVALVLATQGPRAVRFVAAPDAFFARTKTLRDIRGITATLARETTPGSRWLLLAERDSVPNAVLDRYLRWWALDDRVALRGTRDVPAALRILADGRQPLARLTAPPLATVAVGLTPALRAFLGVASDTAPPAGPFAGATIVAWNDPGDGVPVALPRRVLVGATTFVARR